nr:MAG TPA: hypothetical protein [Caudoviricetes sp.]
MGDRATMSLFLKQIAQKFAGLVIINLPTTNGEMNIAGFLSEDPVIKMGNKWEPLIPDLGSINEFMQFANQGTYSWISTSKLAWKSTDPISVTLNFYLITYLKSQCDGTGTRAGEQPISKQASALAELATIGQDMNAQGFLSDIKVRVHGGYHPNYFEADNKIINNQGAFSRVMSHIRQALAKGEKPNSDLTFHANDDTSGTCQIVINGNGSPSVVLTDMLLESVDFTPSTVRAGYWTGITNKGITQQASFKQSPEPLYIKVNASFKLYRAATTADIQKLFYGNKH